MLRTDEFVKLSLGTHLFFARIMKEHALFMQASFPKKNAALAEQAGVIGKDFEKLLEEVVALSNGVVSEEVLRSGEVVTPYTQSAEVTTSTLLGVPIKTSITIAERGLKGDTATSVSPMLERRVGLLNQTMMRKTMELIEFKQRVLTAVESCSLYTTNYPLLLHHIIHEAQLYYKTIHSLQNHEDIDIQRQEYEEQLFWNNIMAEHSKFIRGLLDPSEDDLISTANTFAVEFDDLERQLKKAAEHSLSTAPVTAEALKATMALRDFKETGVKGILSCKLRSIIIPLLADHVLREANHYLRLLKVFSH